MRSGGDALSASVHCTHSVDVHDTARDVREQLRRVESLLATYGGFFHLACVLLVLRRVLK